MSNSKKDVIEIDDSIFFELPEEMQKDLEKKLKEFEED